LCQNTRPSLNEVIDTLKDLEKQEEEIHYGEEEGEEEE
jgi:hypothetical protein